MVLPSPDLRIHESSNCPFLENLASKPLFQEVIYRQLISQAQQHHQAHK